MCNFPVEIVVEKQPSKGQHRKRRERSAMEGMMMHQDGSTHEWVPGVVFINKHLSILTAE